MKVLIWKWISLLNPIQPPTITSWSWPSSFQILKNYWITWRNFVREVSITYFDMKVTVIFLSLQEFKKEWTWLCLSVASILRQRSRLRPQLAVSHLRFDAHPLTSIGDIHKFRILLDILLSISRHMNLSQLLFLKRYSLVDKLWCTWFFSIQHRGATSSALELTNMVLPWVFQ